MLFLSWPAAGSCLEKAGQFAALLSDVTNLVHLHFAKLVSLECCKIKEKGSFFGRIELRR